MTSLGVNPHPLINNRDVILYELFPVFYANQTGDSCGLTCYEGMRSLKAINNMQRGFQIMIALFDIVDNLLGHLVVGRYKQDLYLLREP